jgi:hypothetical protein
VNQLGAVGVEIRAEGMWRDLASEESVGRISWAVAGTDAAKLFFIAAKTTDSWIFKKDVPQAKLRRHRQAVRFKFLLDSTTEEIWGEGKFWIENREYLWGDFGWFWK